MRRRENDGNSGISIGSGNVTARVIVVGDGARVEYRHDEEREQAVAAVASLKAAIKALGSESEYARRAAAAARQIDKLVKEDKPDRPRIGKKLEELTQIIRASGAAIVEVRHIVSQVLKVAAIFALGIAGS
jgi:hypothetical protein